MGKVRKMARIDPALGALLGAPVGIAGQPCTPVAG
jgi:hypothetical protein